MAVAILVLQDTGVIFDKDLDYNRDLVRSSEFGGRKGGTCMPALDRYQGRFFQALGDAGKARCRSSDSLLIVSGLYGLLRASEPVQLYSCPLLADVAAIWQRDALLTDIVCACVKRNDVLRVFDLTATPAFELAAGRPHERHARGRPRSVPASGEDARARIAAPERAAGMAGASPRRHLPIPIPTG